MVKVIKYNISKAGRVYQDKNGVERKVWDNVGTLTEFLKDDGSISRVIEIPAIGLTANAYAIEQKPSQPNKQPSAKSNEVHVSSEGIEYPSEDIDPEDIPF